MNIQVSVKNKIAMLTTPESIVCGNSDYTITFDFDDEWSAETVKTARFAYRRSGENKYKDVVFSGNTVNVPVLSNVTVVLVGVFVGELRTTTPAVIGCEKSILCGGGTHEEPPEDVYNQLLAVCNGLVSQSANHLRDTNNPHEVTAEQVGARPNTWMPTASEVGAAPMSYAKKVGKPHNLLDNSDFRNPVNQRGNTTLSGSWVYFIDRWQVIGGTDSFWLESGETPFVGFPTNGRLLQKIPGNLLEIGKTYTVVVKSVASEFPVFASGRVVDNNATVFNSNVLDGLYVYLYGVGDGKWYLSIDNWAAYYHRIQWVALYEGEYTAETLPEYQPKGYAAEFAECRRYYQKGTQTVTVGTQYGSTDTGMVRLRFENMRITPTISLISVSSQGWGNVAVSNFAVGWNGKDGAEYSQNYIVSGDSTFVGQTVGIAYEASADL